MVGVECAGETHLSLGDRMLLTGRRDLFDSKFKVQSKENFTLHNCGNVLFGFLMTSQSASLYRYQERNKDVFPQQYLISA